MRLEILNSGYRFGTKILFAFIRLVSGQPLPDAARLVFYRPDFYGTPMGESGSPTWTGPPITPAPPSTLTSCSGWTWPLIVTSW